MKKTFLSLVFLCLSLSSQSEARQFEKVVIIVLENTNEQQAISHPYLKLLADQGAYLSQMNGVIHPSQGNYIAMIAGDTFSINHDFKVDLDSNHIGDLLESKGRSWKVYAEGYPGNCFKGTSKGQYVRKHVPFMSMLNVSTNPTRCANIVNSQEFFQDYYSNQLPDYSLFIPDNSNNGHDTGIDFAGAWLQSTFGGIFSNPIAMQNTLFIITFDESSNYFHNKIYTVFLGASVLPGSKTNQKLDHYSILKMIEIEWDLGHLGRKDATATLPQGIWR
ncbi:MAG: hypothetical protein BroJett040_21380 [Oligoflexia bacterium]|nr:MAG: hypothetical protein BroJett040_21380 [Oligoflexia bacterium]